MKINRLIDTPYFTEEFCARIDNQRQKMSRQEVLSNSIYSISNKAPQEFSYVDICMLLIVFVRKGSFVLGSDEIPEKDFLETKKKRNIMSSFDLFEQLISNDLELACIRVIVAIFQEYNQPSKEYWSKYKGTNYNQLKDIWFLLDKKAGLIYEEFYASKKLDVLINRATELDQKFQFKQFEDFQKKIK
jgi:hypothetical protein